MRWLLCAVISVVRVIVAVLGKRTFVRWSAKAEDGFALRAQDPAFGARVAFPHSFTERLAIGSGVALQRFHQIGEAEHVPRARLTEATRRTDEVALAFETRSRHAPQADREY